MDYQKIKTLAELKKAKYKQKSIKDELRENLIYNIQNKINVFQGSAFFVSMSFVMRKTFENRFQNRSKVYHKSIEKMS